MLLAGDIMAVNAPMDMPMNAITHAWPAKPFTRGRYQRRIDDA